MLIAYFFHVEVRQIAYRISSESNGRIFSQIAKPSRPLHELGDEERQAHCLIAAGGMAGELVATGQYNGANHGPLSVDKKILATLTSANVTDFLEPAQDIIKRNRTPYDDLCATMRLLYPGVRERIISSGRPGIYELLSKKDLDTILADVS